MPNDPMVDRTPEEQEALYKAFARSYMDPTGGTFQNALATYKAVVDPDPPPFSLRKQPYRYLNHRITKTEMARIKTETASVVAVRDGVTLAEYVHECWTMAMLFKERGMIGDSTAATQAMKLVGGAMGYLAPKETGPQKPVQTLSPGEFVAKLEGQLAMFKQLQAPQAQPQPIAEADYTIEEEQHGTDQRGPVPGPDHGR